MKQMILDANEPGYLLSELRRVHPLAPVTSQKLPAGDIWLVGTDYMVIVERKTIPDLLESIRDRRLENQIVESFNFTKNVVLLIEGVIETNDDGLIKWDESGHGIGVTRTSKWTQTSVWGYLTKIQRLGAVIRMYQQNMAVELQSIFRLFENDVARITPRTTPESDDPHVTFLACLPGMGIKRANALWDKYGNLAAALAFLTNPDDDTWPHVDGIGPKTRNNVRNFIGASLVPMNDFNRKYLQGDEHGND